MNRAFSNIRKRRVAIAVIGFLLGSAFLSFRLIQGRTSQDAVSTLPVPVTVGTPTSRDLPIWLSGIGTVQPLNVVNIKVRVDGTLLRMYFVEGQEVKPGDVLAQIDPRPFQAQLKQAQANLQKDQVQLANSQAELTRYANLAELGAAPSQNVDTWKAQVASLTAAVLADQAMVDTAALQLEFTTITSPIAGRVGLRQVDPGSIVHTTDANGLVTITQMHPIAVIFSLPQDQIGQILAQQALSKLPVAIYTRDGARHLADGKLEVVDNQVEQSSGQIRLKASFANADHALWPGEFVSAQLLLRTERNAVVVPAQAVMTGANGTYLYMLRPDGTAEARLVKVGPTVEGFAAILSGATPAETVVLEGQARLFPGAKVAVRRASSEAIGSQATP
jgi:membrane fusion protein, multidrug efflux system